MDATTFHELNQVIHKLHTFVQGAMYLDGRGGMVPPSDILRTVEGVRDALATMDAIIGAPRLK